MNKHLKKFWIGSLLSTLYYLFPTVSMAQITFEKVYGDSIFDLGFSVQQTQPDGGYIIGGYSNSFGTGTFDVWLLKTDSLGDTLWTKVFGETNENEYGYSVQQTRDGGYIVTGRKYRFYNSVWLIKTDSLGATLWTKTFGDTLGSIGFSVQETSDGGYIITGTSFGAVDDDVYLIKTDSLGDSLWAKTYGGMSNEEGYSVQQTQSDGGYIISGYTGSFGAGSSDVWLIKTNSLGDTLWTKAYGGIFGDYGYSVDQTSDQGYIITGLTRSFGAGNFDVYLIRTDSLGDTLWTRTFGGTNWDEGRSVHGTSDGGYIITGSNRSFGSDVWLIKTDSLGDSLWTKTFGGSNWSEGYSVQQTQPDGGYIITGLTYLPSPDVYLVKTDSLGNVYVGVEEENTAFSNQHSAIRLFQNYPNPFHSTTLIRYTIPEGVGARHAVPVRLVIYDIAGRLVEICVDESQKPGIYQLPITHHQLPGSGIYFFRLTAGGFDKSNLYISTRKLVLLR